jgi:hypothetical protein
VVAAMSMAVEGMHVVLFELDWGDRLSSQFRIEPWRLKITRAGGHFARSVGGQKQPSAPRFSGVCADNAIRRPV